MKIDAILRAFLAEEIDLYESFPPPARVPDVILLEIHAVITRDRIEQQLKETVRPKCKFIS